MIDNAKERAALAVSELQQGGEDFERANTIFVRSTETAGRIAELVVEFTDLMESVYANNMDINQRIFRATGIGATAIEDLASVGISNKRPEVSDVMGSIGDLYMANTETHMALLEFQEMAIAVDQRHGSTLESLMQVGLDAMALQLTMQDVVGATTQARLSAEALDEDTL